MAVLIPDERCFVLARLIFFLQMKTEQAIYGTSAAVYKVLEPHCCWGSITGSVALFVREVAATKSEDETFSSGKMSHFSFQILVAILK